MPPSQSSKCVQSVAMRRAGAIVGSRLHESTHSNWVCASAEKALMPQCASWLNSRIMRNVVVAVARTRRASGCWSSRC